MTQIDVLAPTRAAGAGRASTAQCGGLVHVVDADARSRALLTRWFEAAGIEAKSHACLDEIVGSTVAARPQCLVIDMDALSSARFGAGSSPLPVRFPLIVIAQQPDIAMAVMAMKTGATDFVEKPLRESEIVAVVSSAMEADRGRVERDARTSILRERFGSLSRREQQVMALVTAGKLNKQVGGALSLSEVTVKAHRGGAMRKMVAHTFAELVRMAEVLDEELAPLRSDC